MSLRPPAAAPKDVAAAAAPVEAAAFPPPEIAAACEELVGRYPSRLAALLPVLHLAQRHHGGWVPPEVEAGVARWIGCSAAHVHGVLTFYRMYNTQPAGRHEVWVCRTLTCWLRGAPALRRVALEKAGCERTGEVGPDGRFSVKDMECLGVCEQAPAVWVDGAVHAPVTPDDFAALLDGCK